VTYVLASEADGHRQTGSFLKYREYHLQTSWNKAQKRGKRNIFNEFLNFTKSLAKKSSKTKTSELSIQVRTAHKVSNTLFGYSLQYEKSTVTISCSLQHGSPQFFLIKKWWKFC